MGARRACFIRNGSLEYTYTNFIMVVMPIPINLFLLQCGQGNNDDLLKPTCVASLLGNKTEAVAAGLWHTICIGADGRVHAFGGNQFGQLGLGTSSEQCEVI